MAGRGFLRRVGHTLSPHWGWRWGETRPAQRPESSGARPCGSLLQGPQCPLTWDRRSRAGAAAQWRLLCGCVLCGLGMGALSARTQACRWPAVQC